MKAFLDPEFRRQTHGFVAGPPVDAAPLPTIDVRRFAPRKMPRKLAGDMSTEELRERLPPRKHAPLPKEEADASRRALWK